MSNISGSTLMTGLGIATLLGVTVFSAHSARGAWAQRDKAYEKNGKTHSDYLVYHEKYTKAETTINTLQDTVTAFLTNYHVRSKQEEESINREISNQEQLQKNILAFSLLKEQKDTTKAQLALKEARFKEASAQQTEEFKQTTDILIKDCDQLKSENQKLQSEIDKLTKQDQQTQNALTGLGSTLTENELEMEKARKALKSDRDSETE